MRQALWRGILQAWLFHVLASVCGGSLPCGSDEMAWRDMSLALFLRTCASQACVHTYERDLRPSLLAFFPWRLVPLIVVLDHEDPRNQASGMFHRFSARPPFAAVRLSINEDDPSVWVRGHERQQYSQFHADLYTDKDTVGFVDSDTLFVTPVTPGDLFDHKRPIVIAQVGRPADDFWTAIPQLTRRILKVDHVCRGMSYFPVRTRVKFDATWWSI